MIARKITFWLLTTLLSMGALAQNPSAYMQSGATRINVLGQNYSAAAGIAPNQSQIVVYSPEDSSLPGATSIFVNGRYHASLTKGAYTDLCYAPGTVNLGARQVKVGEHSEQLPDSTASMSLQGGQVHYLRVREQAGRAELYPVSAAEAQQELPTKRLQLHTISRVAQGCAGVDEPSAASAAAQSNQQEVF